MRMRKKTGYLLLMLLLLLVPVAVWADKTTVDDQAGLFSQEEEQELTDRIVELTTDWNMDFVVVTTEDAEGKTAEEYADDYYDYNGYAEDGVLYLIDLDNGSVWISTAGKMIRYLTDARIDAVIDAGYDNLKAKNYADGILEMLNETERYLEDGIPSDQYNYDTETGKISRYRSITVYEAIGAAVIALLCGGGFAAAVLGGYGNMYGAIIGGLIVGVVETMAAGYLSSSFKDIISFGVLIVVLFVMPHGILKGHKGQ